MRIHLAWLLTPFISGCAVMTADPWSWLDDPSKQAWAEVTLVSDNWEVKLQVPDRRTAGIERLVSIPPLERGADSLLVEIPQSSIHDLKRMAYFQWESWWGGFLKDSGVDFSLDIWVYNYPETENLLTLEMQQLIDWRVLYWKDAFAHPLMEDYSGRDYFFEHFRIEPYRSSKGTEWIFENSPSTKGDSVSYMTPLSEHEILDVGFFVNQKRYDWKEDAEWNQRRWELSRKILDTVTITPRN